MNAKPTPQGSYEGTDANPRTLVIWGLVLLSVLVFSIAAAWVVFDVLTAVAERNDRKPSPLASTDGPRGPRLLTNEPANLEAVLEEQDRILDSYGWVDKERGVVRIPIEEAMALLVKEAAKRTDGGSSS